MKLNVYHNTQKCIHGTISFFLFLSMIYDLLIFLFYGSARHLAVRKPEGRIFWSKETRRTNILLYMARIFWCTAYRMLLLLRLMNTRSFYFVTFGRRHSRQSTASEAYYISFCNAKVVSKMLS